MVLEELIQMAVGEPPRVINHSENAGFEMWLKPLNEFSAMNPTG